MDTGIFCAFTSLEAEDVAAVRFHIFAMPELPRDDPSALRVHLIPDLPNQNAESLLSESSEWGLTNCIGQSPIFYICQGKLPGMYPLALATAQQLPMSLLVSRPSVVVCAGTTSTKGQACVSPIGRRLFQSHVSGSRDNAHVAWHKSEDRVHHPRLRRRGLLMTNDTHCTLCPHSEHAALAV